MSGLTLETRETRMLEKRTLNLTRGAGRAVMAAVTGTFLGVLTVAFIYLLVFGYFVFTPEDAERSEAARELATGWAPTLFFTLGVWVGAFSLGMWARGWRVSLGALVGVSAAVAEQATILFGYPPIVMNEFVLFLGLGTLAGVCGGWFSRLEATRSEAGEKILFREMVHIARAQNPDAVAEAIANLVGRERVAGVGVWRSVSSGGHATTRPDGVWEADGSGSLPAAMLLEEARRRTRRRDCSVNLMPDALDSKTRKSWADAGVRSAFASPLICMGGEQLGFLLVSFRRTTLLAGVSRRRVLSTAAAGGMALEKLASVKKQREQDRQLGIMEERERVSREIHDSLIQYLGSIAGELDAAEMAAEAGVMEMAPHHISRAHEATHLATSETRRLMRALRPVMLDRSSLTEALTALTRCSLTASGIEAKFRVVGEVRPLASEMEHDLIRIAQEALSNASKHSHASRVDVTLSFEADRVTLEVADDGIGLDSSALTGVAPAGGADSGFGLQSMRERTERIGGQMYVESSEGRGTKMIFEAPGRNGRG